MFSAQRVKNFSATVVVYMNNHLNESHIGKLYQTQAQNGTQPGILSQGGGKNGLVTNFLIFPIFKECVYLFLFL